MYNKINCNYAIQMNKNLPVIQEVISGQRFQVETINAFGDNFKDLNDLMDLIKNKYGERHHHPLTGPINVQGAKPGDVLKITINSIKTDKMAQCLSQTAGVSPIKANHFADRAPIVSSYSPEEDDIYYCNGIHIPYKPMLGIIGTAPDKDFIKTGHAARTGGNLDIPFVTQGTSVYLPVEVEGGYLFLGDVHGNQGYGELGGVALEASAVVDITVEVLHPRQKFDYILISGKEPYSGKKAVGIVGVGDQMADIHSAIANSYQSSMDMMLQVFPTFTRNTIANLVTIIGHSFNGQAFSKTSESTCVVNILEEDIRKVKQDPAFDISCDIENILFKKGDTHAE